MASYNKVILIGHLTRDPEIKFMPDSTPLCKFGLALNEKFKTADGTLQETVHFVDCEAWNKTAEVIGEHFKKGKPILVEGSLKYDSWETEAGEKRSKLKVRVFRFEFIGSKQDADADAETDAAPADAPPPDDIGF